MAEENGNRGLTQRELLLEVREDVKSIKAEQKRVQEALAIETEAINIELGKRPTRGELMLALGAILGVVGTMITLYGLPGQ